MFKGEWEDKIYKAKEFIQQLDKVQNNYYEELRESLIVDGFDKLEELDDYLWDFIFNEPLDIKIEFEEYIKSSN